MKKILYIVAITLVLFFSGPQVSFAKTIYSNDFKSDISDFNFFFGSCNTSEEGMTCQGDPGNLGAAGVTKIPYVNAKCVSFETNNTNNIPQLLLSDSILDERIIASFQSGNNIQIYLLRHSGETHWDSGIAVPSGAHKLQLCEGTNTISIYVDNTSVWKQAAIFSHFDHLGFYVQPGTALTNFLITDTLPNQLDVPLLKQTAEPWQSQEYDSAKKWNLANPTINAWGCAMTSAAMVFNYHGINKLPDGTNLDPGTLNAWLKSQPDGYVRTGWVNWLALARLSRESTEINNITTFDALEYNRVQGANKAKLTDDLNNQIPGILEEPGHFIVATGVNGDTFDINDPYYDRETLQNNYNNTFLNLGRFVPSHTDLSYIMLVADPNVTITVTDENGNTVGESFIQNPIVNPSDPTQANSPINIYYLQKPATGTYTVKTAGTSTYTIASYLYDQEGDFQMENTAGIGTTTLTIAFNKASNDDSSTKKIITFASTVQDIKNAEKLHLINNGLGEALIAFVATAQRQSDKHVAIAKRILDQGIKLLEKSKGHAMLIKPSAYEILIADFTELKNSL